MFLGRIHQSFVYRAKKALNPFRNFYLNLKIPYLSVGKGSEIGKVSWAPHRGNVHIGQGTVIADWVCIMPYGGEIRIGDNCTVNSFCHLSGNGGLTIGNNVRIAAHCVLIPANHNFKDPTIPIIEQGESQLGIIIEDDVWLGAGVKILDGVEIGKGSVVGAGSVVTKNIPPMSIAVGNPAKVIKKRE